MDVYGCLGTSMWNLENMKTTQGKLKVMDVSSEKEKEFGTQLLQNVHRSTIVISSLNYILPNNFSQLRQV